MPAELWLLVAQYLPDKELMKLLSLNRVFLELAMDRRYRDFVLMGSPNWYMEKVEKLLQSSEHVATRVQVLTLAPEDTWEAINYQRPPKPRIPTKRRFTKSIKHFFAGGTRAVEATSTPTIQSAFPFEKSPQEKRYQVVCAAKTLVNLRDLKLVWRSKEDEDIPQYWPQCCPFLEVLLPTFGQNLRSLSLILPSSPASALTWRGISVTSLEELNIDYDAEDGSNDDMVPLLPLINGTSRTLKSLSIEARGGLGNLSTFFNGMQKLPFLHRLSLVMPLGPTSVPDPSGLSRLLNHRLSGLYIRSEDGWYYERISGHEWLAWYNQCVEGVALDTVQELLIGFPSYIDIDLCRQFVDPIPPCQRLTSLTILDIHFSHLQVPLVLTAFNGPLLKSLSIVVQVFCLELVDVLATKCPRLNQLCLYFDSLHSPLEHECDLVSGLPQRTNGRTLI
ncbi:hypothetical protein DXG01_007195 [Tephrocybe rancida]|nr:hypothetical protein DXG01_007195 [Tephrocybe rancida]